MATAKEITKYCQNYLSVDDFQDYCHNGCQVEGVVEVTKVITGVSLSQKLIEQAIEKKAEMIIAHHGFFLDAFGSPAVIKGVMRDRLKMLLDNNINLLGFHLPLDAHPKIGNNFSICKTLGIKNIEPVSVGFVGDLDKELDFDDFLNRVNNVLGVDAYNIAVGKKKVKRIGVNSGGASQKISDFQEAGADTFLSGDIKENVVREAEETGMNFINAGHYNTEKLGVQNLGKLIEKKFDIEVEFVDIPNEI